ncbi:hypothetical protein [Brevundimonas sp. SL130]|uniref:hypothetical protein n=1 Tax=Brevundimonas sp. SL130 TaxID=2995143 RepID=UPI00226D32E1|nr:hypothetical protein [Brevundimonas sp. SL130]WAC58784.1 hypothetical protein OU998_11220 [Brevundimonas sp. SL130]
MKTRIIAGVLALSLIAGAAQAMTVQEFLTTAAGIPQNPTALLRSDTRRLMGEFRGAARTVRAEQTAATAAGRAPATCMPDKVGFSPDEILGRFNTIPQARRNISVTQAMREWMIEKYPCPG